MDTIKVGLVDDHALIRIGIRESISNFDGINVIFDVADGKSLFMALKIEVPDVLLLDMKMPDMSGVEITDALSKAYPKLRVIILSNYDYQSYVSSMILKGASSYLSKSIEPGKLEKIIHEVNENGLYITPEQKDLLISNRKLYKSIPAFQEEGLELSPRETELLKLICNQYTVSEIAIEMAISTRTVEGHKANLYSKIGTKSVAGLVMFAIQEGIFEIPMTHLNRSDKKDE